MKLSLLKRIFSTRYNAKLVRQKQYDNPRIGRAWSLEIDKKYVVLLWDNDFINDYEY